MTRRPVKEPLLNEAKSPARTEASDDDICTSETLSSEDSFDEGVDAPQVQEELTENKQYTEKLKILKVHDDYWVTIKDYSERLKKIKLNKKMEAVLQQSHHIPPPEDKSQRLAQELPNFNWLEMKIRNGGVSKDVPPKHSKVMPKKPEPIRILDNQSRCGESERPPVIMSTSEARKNMDQVNRTLERSPNPNTGASRLVPPSAEVLVQVNQSGRECPELTFTVPLNHPHHTAMQKQLYPSQHATQFQSHAPPLHHPMFTQAASTQRNLPVEMVMPHPIQRIGNRNQWIPYGNPENRSVTPKMFQPVVQSDRMRAMARYAMSSFDTGLGLGLESPPHNTGVDNPSLRLLPHHIADMRDAKAYSHYHRTQPLVHLVPVQSHASQVQRSPVYVRAFPSSTITKEPMYTRSPVPQHSPRDQNDVEEERMLYNARLEYRRRIDNAEKMNKALMEKAAANFDRNKTDSDGEVEIIQVTGRHDFPPQTTREHKDRRSKRISLDGRTVDANYSSSQRTPERLERSPDMPVSPQGVKRLMGMPLVQPYKVQRLNSNRNPAVQTDDSYLNKYGPVLPESPIDLSVNKPKRTEVSSPTLVWSSPEGPACVSTARLQGPEPRLSINAMLSHETGSRAAAAVSFIEKQLSPRAAVAPRCSPNFQAPGADLQRCNCCGQIAKFQCSTCRQASYCSEDCQLNHWTAQHNKECRFLAVKK